VSLALTWDWLASGYPGFGRVQWTMTTIGAALVLFSKPLTDLLIKTAGLEKEILLRGLSKTLLGGVGLFACLHLIVSMRWGMELDTAILHYIAFLISEHDYRPYQDIFDINMPGSYLVHIAIGKLLGYSDSGFRLANVFWLLCITSITWLIMARISRMAAFAACSIFVIFYVGGGPTLTLQRDLIGTLPIAIAVYLLLKAHTSRQPFWMPLLVGFCCGTAMMIKPHMLVALPVALLFPALVKHGADIFALSSVKQLGKNCAFLALGAGLAIAPCFLWAISKGGAGAFLEMFSEFVPLYAQIDGGLQVTEEKRYFSAWSERFFQFGDRGILALTGLFGIIAALFGGSSQATRHTALLTLAMLLAFSLYVMVPNKYWTYHWTPFLYFSCLASGLIFRPFTPGKYSATRRLVGFGLFVFAVSSVSLPLNSVSRQLSADWVHLPNKGRVEHLADYLERNLKPGEYIQPLDWGSDSLHAMLKAKVKIATPFIYDFQFYHHVSNPYIQDLRKRFIKNLNSNPPKFVIDIKTKHQLSGHDVSREFPELWEFLEKFYTPVHETENLLIFAVNRS